MCVRFFEKGIAVYIIKGFDAMATACMGMVLSHNEFSRAGKGIVAGRRVIPLNNRG